MKTRGGLTALVWKDRQEVYMLTNMDPPPAEGNFCDDSNCPVKSHIVERYNQNMGYVDNSDCCRRSVAPWITVFSQHTVFTIWVIYKFTLV